MPMTSWMAAMSTTTARLEDRIRHLEIRTALMAKDLREIKKTKSGVDWPSLLGSWQTKSLFLLALLAFNWRLEDALKIVFGPH
jgi:hypothetical protein